MANYPDFPVLRFAEIAEQPNRFALLEQVPLLGINAFPHVFHPVVGDERTVIILDTETTGLKADENHIIELGMVKAMYSPSLSQFTSIVDVVSMYEQPPEPISPEITTLTGITNEIVEGKRFDEELVASWFHGDPLIVAHNANFDRPFFEKRFPAQNFHAWGCSLTGIDWKARGYESGKLEYLLLRAGFFYTGHRASIDCLATLWLLHVCENALTELRQSINQKTVLIRAFGAPFDVKDALKTHGYRWHDGINGANKHWWTQIPLDFLEAERAFLDDLYRGSDRAVYEHLDARKRFKG